LADRTASVVRAIDRTQSGTETRKKRTLILRRPIGSRTAIP